MPKNLLIVESPAKAKTIEKYLGRNFKVKSSYGHVRDLEKSDKAVDIENNFKPNYVVSPDKRKVVKDLKDWVGKVEEVWLATDEDREGEAISWHLCQVLGLDENSTKRIAFREITKPAIKNALQTPRTVDLNLVNAQQARRILDRLVGYELSSILWKKVKTNLSAGRVQSVAVKLVVERERAINGFKTAPFYRINAIFDVKNAAGKKVALKAELPTRYDSEQDANAFLKKCLGADFRINKIDVKPIKRRPTAPFTTSTLQQEASRKLFFSVKKTMTVAQRLYEAGLITYMRTDSTNLSQLALESIAEEIEQSYGSEYVKTRQYKGKKALSQEAHEAIRPTYINNKSAGIDRDQQRLYELIWKRTIASQMADAVVEKTTVKIGISTINNVALQAVGEVLKFDGFLKVYLESKDDEEEEEAKGMLPPLKVGQHLQLNEMTAIERFTRAPARFTEASLVKQLEEQGIGRPSTYAPTISKIMEESRGYVIKESREGEERNYNLLTLKDNAINKEVKTEITGTVKNRLFPTDMGMVVTDFLSEHFDNVMDYGFTAKIEKDFDDVAVGKRDWTKMIGGFYEPFHEKVEETIENAGRASGERILGTDPDSGRTVLTRMSRFGKPLVQIGAPDELLEDEKPKYANLKPSQQMEIITLEEALELFKLPAIIGEYEAKEVEIGIGRYGPYVKHDEKFISLGRRTDPLTVTLEHAIELIEKKREEERPIATYQGLPVTRGTGRFGPFLLWNKLYVNIPKKIDPNAITPEQVIELLEKKIEKEANRYIHQWQDLQLSVENGRWGPFIRYNKKKPIKLPKVEGKRMTSEQAKDLTLEEVKSVVLEEYPDAFKKKGGRRKKKG